jgi:hypothetical protein
VLSSAPFFHFCASISPGAGLPLAIIVSPNTVSYAKATPPPLTIGLVAGQQNHARVSLTSLHPTPTFRIPRVSNPRRQHYVKISLYVDNGPVKNPISSGFRSISSMMCDVVFQRLSITGKPQAWPNRTPSKSPLAAP